MCGLPFLCYFEGYESLGCKVWLIEEGHRGLKAACIPGADQISLLSVCCRVSSH